MDLINKFILKKGHYKKATLIKIVDIKYDGKTSSWELSQKREQIIRYSDESKKKKTLILNILNSIDCNKFKDKGLRDRVKIKNKMYEVEDFSVENFCS